MQNWRVYLWRAEGGLRCRALNASCRLYGKRAGAKSTRFQASSGQDYDLVLAAICSNVDGSAYAGEQMPVGAAHVIDIGVGLNEPERMPYAVLQQRL